jgi:hypothetical protein
MTCLSQYVLFSIILFSQRLVNTPKDKKNEFKTVNSCSKRTRSSLTEDLLESHTDINR